MKVPLAVAGIPFVHRAAAPVSAPSQISATWTGSRIVDAPIAVSHHLGSADPGQLQLLFKSPLPNGDYYRDSAGDVAVRFPQSVSGRMRAHLLLTSRRGYEYEIRYEQSQDVERLQREWHRSLLTMALPFRARGLIAHATGFLLPSGAGVLCPGMSGVGKSTLAKLLLNAGEDIAVLSDDRVAVTDETGRLWIWGTPWHSSARAAAPLDAPLGAIVLIEHGRGAALRAVSARYASKRVLRAVGIPFWDRAACEFALAFVERLLDEVPVFAFDYAPSSDAAKALLATLAKVLPAHDGGPNGALCAFR
jgi:hypothetical protein